MTAAPKEIEIVEEVGALLGEIEQALVGTTAGADETFYRLRVRIRAAILQAKRLLEKLRSMIAPRARQVDRFVREHIYFTLTMAVGIGSLVGVFLSKKNSEPW